MQKKERIYKSILFILFIFFFSTVFGQVKSDAAEGHLVFGFTKMVQGEKQIIDPLNGGSINGDELAKAKHIIAFYKTPKGNLTVDSIYYKLVIIWGRRIDPIELDDNEFEINNEKVPGKCILQAAQINGTVLLFSFKKIVLENGMQILNPQPENPQKYVAKGSYYDDKPGIVFRVHN